MKHVTKKTAFAALIASTAFALPSAMADDAVTVDAPSGVYINDPAHTSLTWSIRHLGLSDYTARINDVSITLNLDTNDVTQSTVSAVIEPASVDTGYPGEDKDFNAEIAGEQIFNTDEFPTVTFATLDVTQTAPNEADIHGNLTMLGVTKPVTLKATYFGSTASHPFVKVPAIGFRAETVIDRTEFGLDFLSGSALGDEVSIVIQSEFIKQ